MMQFSTVNTDVSDLDYVIDSDGFLSVDTICNDFKINRYKKELGHY
jgi:hypothetical protein